MGIEVSVVIPAYNAAETVEKTVRNVMSSTIPLEVWVVDDGSSDGTGAILDGLDREYSAGGGSRLHVIHQENRGAYGARLNALKRITTEYFGFVDADDTVEPTMFEKMLRFAKENECDVVQCGVEGVEDAALGKWYAKLSGVRRLETRAEVEERFIRPHLERGEGSSFIWNKLYRNQYDFGGFATFARLTNYDDMILNFQFFEKVRRMGFLEERLYHYAKTAGSATHTYGRRQFEDFMACARFRRERGVRSGRWFWVNVRSAGIMIAKGWLRGAAVSRRPNLSLRRS